MINNNKRITKLENKVKDLETKLDNTIEVTKLFKTWLRVLIKERAKYKVDEVVKYRVKKTNPKRYIEATGKIFYIGRDGIDIIYKITDTDGEEYLDVFECDILGVSK